MKYTLLTCFIALYLLFVITNNMTAAATRISDEMDRQYSACCRKIRCQRARLLYGNWCKMTFLDGKVGCYCDPPPQYKEYYNRRNYIGQ